MAPCLTVLRGVLIFVVICFVIANLFENLAVAMGLPFGRYYFTNAMGAKLFQVPIWSVVAW
jgi:putative membrane protein